MTIYRIVCAGCDEKIIKKFHIVSNLFKARDQYLTVNFEPWDGTRANLVISNIDDAYGLKVARQAHQRGMELFILASNLRSVPGDLESVARDKFLAESSPISLMFKQFSNYFCNLEDRHKLNAADPTLILFKNLLKQEHSVYLTYNFHTVFHHVENGTCIADSQETVAYIQKAIQSKNPVEISAAAPDNFKPHVSISAEDFYFHAFADVADMPALPGGLVRLDCWPNIKSNDHANEIVGIAPGITQRFMPVKQVLEQHAEIAKPYLLATALARLLSYREKTLTDPNEVQPEASDERPGIIQKLGRWLGLTAKARLS